MKVKTIKIIVALTVILALLSGCLDVNTDKANGSENVRSDKSSIIENSSDVSSSLNIDTPETDSETSVSSSVTSVSSSVTSVSSSEPPTNTRATQVVNEFKNLIAKDTADKNSKIQPVFGRDDTTLLCTIGNFELHIKKEESYSGDSTSFGVYDNLLNNWTVPYTVNSKLLTSGVVDTSEMMRCRNSNPKSNKFTGSSGSTLSYHEDGIISCNDYFSGFWNNYLWFYDFLNDRFAYTTISYPVYNYL